MKTGITLSDVREEALSAIQKLKAGDMDTKTASEIRNLLNVIIDTGKTQVEFLKAIPEPIRQQMDKDSIKAIAGTLRDRDAELDETLTLIEKGRNSYELSSKQ